MNELCFTPAQVKAVKILIGGMVGISFVQAIMIRRLQRDYVFGLRKFDDLKKGTLYILNMLEENNVDMSQFDEIALSAILQGDQ